MKDFLAFRKMVSTTIIKLIYILGVIGLTISGVVSFFRGFMGFPMGFPIGLGTVVFGNLLWRVFCEIWILLFSIHDTLGRIEKNLGQKSF